MGRRPPRLERVNTATLALRSVVRQVVAVNREVAEEDTALARPAGVLCVTRRDA